MEKGDTLSGIAVKFGVPVWKIVYDNQLKDKNQIVPGQALLLLEVDEGQAEESTQPELAKGKTIGGYAYPFIDKEILEQSFPALKELLVFSYGFTFEGNLVPPLQDDLWMIETAWRHGAKPIMVLTPFSEGAFNNQLVKVLTENVEVQERLLEQLTAEVRRRGFAGVNIDFEYVLPENKVQYAAFIGKMRELLRPEGYTVSVAVPPKVSNEQRGLLVEGADYRLIGENADYGRISGGSSVYDRRTGGDISDSKFICKRRRRIQERSVACDIFAPERPQRIQSGLESHHECFGYRS